MIQPKVFRRLHRATGVLSGKTIVLVYQTNGFSVQNNHLNLCGQVENTKWILRSRKPGVKCEYLRFLMNKYTLRFCY